MRGFDVGGRVRGRGGCVSVCGHDRLLAVVLLLRHDAVGGGGSVRAGEHGLEGGFGFRFGDDRCGFGVGLRHDGLGVGPGNGLGLGYGFGLGDREGGGVDRAIMSSYGTTGRGWA